MAPYHEIVINRGDLQVWSTEWEVLWSNDHPLTLEGSRDLRYSCSGTRLTRERVVDLAKSLPSEWESAVALSEAVDPTGSFSKPGYAWPVTLVVTVGKPSVLVRDIGRLVSQEQCETMRRELLSLIDYADKKRKEIQRLYSVKSKAT